MKKFFLIIFLFTSSVSGETYKQIWGIDGKPSTEIIIRSDGASIPLVDGNRDFDVYKKWLAAGNQPLPPDPIPVPTMSEMDRLKADIQTLKNDVSLLKGTKSAAPKAK
jgi:hypothetical protein